MKYLLCKTMTVVHLIDASRGEPNQAQTEPKSNHLILGEVTSGPEGEKKMSTERKLQTFGTSVVKVIMTLSAANISSS